MGKHLIFDPLWRRRNGRPVRLRPTPLLARLRLDRTIPVKDGVTRACLGDAHGMAGKLLARGIPATRKVQYHCPRFCASIFAVRLEVLREVKAGVFIWAVGDVPVVRAVLSQVS